MPVQISTDQSSIEMKVSCMVESLTKSPIPQLAGADPEDLKEAAVKLYHQVKTCKPGDPTRPAVDDIVLHFMFVSVSFRGHLAVLVVYCAFLAGDRESTAVSA